jgi:hypothetical protein
MEPSPAAERWAPVAFPPPARMWAETRLFLVLGPTDNDRFHRPLLGGPGTWVDYSQ